MAAPLTPDLQPLWDQLQTDVAAAATADQTKTTTAAALTAAQQADSDAGAAQLKAHQSVTADVTAFITQFQKDFPSS